MILLRLSAKVPFWSYAAGAFITSSFTKAKTWKSIFS